MLWAMKPWIKYRKHTFLRLSGSLTTVMNGYSTYCPIAKAAEILTERWTLLLVRGLLLGARHLTTSAAASR
jgi:hypothetical protein